MHGGQAVPMFDYCMAPGVAKTYRKQYYKALGYYFNAMLDMKLEDASLLCKKIEQSLPIKISMSTADKFGKLLADFLPKHQREHNYQEINEYSSNKGIEWMASAWDVEAQKFLQQFNLKYNKVASAMLGNFELLTEIAKEGRFTYISTGMSTYEEVDAVVNIFKQYNCPFEIMHCNSTYPMKPEDANLRLIPILKERYKVDIGFSSHEIGVVATLGAVALGATSIERHITLDRNMYGSDQKASTEPDELIELVKQIRVMESALGNGEKTLTVAELEVRKKLRG